MWQEAKQSAGNDDMIYNSLFPYGVGYIFLIMLYDVADRVSGAEVVPSREVADPLFVRSHADWPETTPYHCAG